MRLLGRLTPRTAGLLALVTVAAMGVVVWQAGWLSAPETSIPEATVVKARGPIAIDSRLEEPDWARAERLRDFVISTSGRRAPLDVDARMLWDEQALYVMFDVEDYDIVSTFTQRDDALYTEDVVELFLDPNGDGKDYVELEVSPNGVLFDALFPSYRKALERSKRWNLPGLRAAVATHDEGYRVELRVPFDGLPGGAPNAGDTWRAHLYRIDQHGEGEGHFTAWSAPLAPDFHVLARMGTLRFVD